MAGAAASGKSVFRVRRLSSRMEVKMKYLVSAAEMKCYDGNTIEKIGIPACVLMERAALAVAEEAEGCHGTRNGERHALVMAGIREAGSSS